MAKGVSKEIARNVFKKLLGFAAYFPKAHAAAFAVLAFQSCWLKYYYPAEFTCAHEQPADGLLPAPRFDERRHGTGCASSGRTSISASSAARWRGTPSASASATCRAWARRPQRVVLERMNGAYRSLADFLRRVPLSTEAIENLRWSAPSTASGWDVARRSG